MHRHSSDFPGRSYGGSRRSTKSSSRNSTELVQREWTGERAYLGVFGDCAAYEIAGGIDFEQAASFCVRLL